MKKFNRIITLIILLLFSTNLMATDFSAMLYHAEKGDKNAQFLVGFSYLNGEYRDGTDIEQDNEKALYWIKMSAENDFSYAQYFLGGMYNQGIIVEKNFKAASAWFLKAAMNGEVLAQTNIAGFYYYGTGIIKDLYESYAWASLASFQGNENAANLVEMIIPKLDDRDKANALALEYFTKYTKRTN